jgi:menaquinone-dependent protoporphyrinogen oxidase
MGKVLVSYATKYGSTKEVAEKIADNMRAQADDVDVMSVDDVKSIDGYDKVVFGAALYAGNISGPAKKFLNRNRAVLAGKPVSMFLLGPISRDEKEMTGAEDQMAKVLAKYDWFKPVSSQIFVGKFDLSMLKWPFSLVAKMKGTPLYGETLRDERDWDAISAWAASI